MKKSVLISGIISLSLVICDLVIKQIFVRQEPDISLGFLRFHLVKNTGVSFGMFQGYNIVFVIISLLVLISVAVFFRRIPAQFQTWALIACGGVMSNLVDRILLGFVVDYIDLGWWPVFNIADSMIVLSAVVLSAHIIREDVFKKK